MFEIWKITCGHHNHFHGSLQSLRTTVKNFYLKEMYVLFCPQWKQVAITIPHKILPYFNYFDAAMKSSPSPVTPKTMKTFLTSGTQLKAFCSPKPPSCDGDRDAQSLTQSQWAFGVTSITTSSVTHNPSLQWQGEGDAWGMGQKGTQFGVNRPRSGHRFGHSGINLGHATNKDTYPIPSMSLHLTLLF